MKDLKETAVSWLRWSEKYTKTDMVHLSSAGGWLSVGFIISSLVAFLMSIAFANLVDKETYGVYRFVLSVGIIIGAFSLTGLKTSVTQAVAKGFDATLAHAFRERLLWSIPMFLIALGTSTYYFVSGDAVLGSSLIVVALFNPLLYSSTLYAAYLNGKEEYMTIAFYGIGRAMFPALALVVALLVSANVVELVITYFASHTLLAFFFYRRTLKRVPKGTENDDASNTYGKHLSVTNLIDVAASQLDKILVFHFVGAPGLAVYFFALSIPEQISGLFSNVYPLALPKFAKRDIAILRPLIFKKMLRFGIVLSVVVIGYIIMAPWVYRTFFPRYTDAILLSQIASLSMLTLVGLLPTAVLHAKKAQRVIYILRGTGSIFRIGILVALVIPYGLMGIIIASLISKCFDAVITAYAVRFAKEPSGITQQSQVV